MTKRDYQLSFCKYCVHQRFDRSEGLICSLTNVKAAFDEECIDFIRDDSVVENTRKKLKTTHPSSLTQSTIFSKKLHIDLPGEAIEIRKSRFKYLTPILLFIIVITVFPLIELSANSSSTEQNKIWIIPFLFIDTIALLLFFGRDYLKEELVLRLSQTGIKVNGESTPWSNYVGFAYHKEVEGFGLRKKTHHTIVLKFIGRKDVEINMGMLSISKMELIQMIEKFEKNFASQRL
jgi:hypothetical protein